MPNIFDRITPQKPEGAFVNPTPEQSKLWDNYATAEQAKLPLWKRALQSITEKGLDIPVGAIEGMLGKQPTNKSSVRDWANLGTQALQAGLPFAAIRKGMPVYHGTNLPFDDLLEAGKNLNLNSSAPSMLHFGENINDANEYASGIWRFAQKQKNPPKFPESSRIYPALVDAKNVFDTSNVLPEDIKAVLSIVPESKRISLLNRYDKNIKRLGEKEALANLGMTMRSEILQYPKQLQKAGFDAIRYGSFNLDSSFKGWAVPNTTPITTPWGTPLNQAAMVKK